MLRIQRILRSEILHSLASIATIILLILSALSLVIPKLPIKEYIPQLSSFLAKNLLVIFSIFTVLALLYLYLTLSRLQRRITIGLRDNFKDDLKNNWEYRGEWSKPEKGVLCVRGGDEGSRGDEGGITKVGALWENYEFSFETKITNKVTGWIVRARDLNNYFMLQCSHEVITPHQRLSQPLFKSKPDPNSPDKTSFELTGFEVGWRRLPPVPHNKKLDDWFKVKIVTRGSSLDIFIDNQLIFHRENILTIPVGRVGFRCWGDEEAHFRKVRVKLID